MIKAYKSGEFAFQANSPHLILVGGVYFNYPNKSSSSVNKSSSVK